MCHVGMGGLSTIIERRLDFLDKTLYRYSGLEGVFGFMITERVELFLIHEALEFSTYIRIP